MAEKRPDRTLGGNHDTFWQWCGKGELHLPRCTGCGELAWPVVDACEFCGGRTFDWQAMSGSGTIAAWCCFERDYYGGLLPLPWNTILVELAEGPLFLANPKDFTWRDITIGMEVRLAFIDCEDSAGAFQLPVFERI